MLICVIRVTLLYLLVLFSIRILGKRQISEFQPFELVVTMMIADIATQPIGDVDVPLLYGIIPVIVFIFLQTTLSFLTYKNEKIRTFICGKPEYLIYDGKIMQKQMNEMLIGIDDLCEQLRNNDVLDVNEVAFLILEANGEPSIIKKNDNGLPISLIKYGLRLEKSFKLVNYNNEKLDKVLKKKGINNDSEVFWAYIYNDEFYLVRKDDF